ncbi:uncharacterized protein LOC143241118 isoform X2 [Tachypleus tridentatus]|uniref:uncharacterized protein LOC143241118 isoform X2 n=1 Tax=Tachypleus tridentatus TaxID=6853 RepID=UPI003FD38CC1
MMYGVSKRIVVVDVYNDVETSPKDSNQTKKPRLTQNGTFNNKTSSVEGFKENLSPNENFSPLPNLLKSTDIDEFVTVLKVEDRLPPVPEGEEEEDGDHTMNHKQEVVPTRGSFVTVLEVNNYKNDEKSSADEKVIEEVIVYRLPGERLGMALKFEGGVNVTDSVSRVFIQSINPESPAARAQCFLRPLQEGDEILKIDNRSVCEMTRLDCVTLLRDAPVCIKMLVKHQTPNSTIQNGENTMNGQIRLLDKITEAIKTEDKPPLPRKRKGPPPPVPPRKPPSSSNSPVTFTQQEELGLSVSERIASIEKTRLLPERPRKRPSQPPPLPPRLPKPPQETDHLPEKPPFRGGALSMKLPGWEELMQRRLARLEDPEHQEEDGERPSEANVYTDLLSGEDVQIRESESDDTGSSVSTVIERFSRTSTANSSFSEHSSSQEKPSKPFDLEQVLSPFEQLERELDDDERNLDISDDSELLDSTEVVEPEEFTIEPPESFQDCFLSDRVVEDDLFPTKSVPDTKQNEPYSLDYSCEPHIFNIVNSSAVLSLDEQDVVPVEHRNGHSNEIYSYYNVGENSNEQLDKLHKTLEVFENEALEPKVHEKNLKTSYINSRSPSEDKDICIGERKSSVIEEYSNETELYEEMSIPPCPRKIKTPLNSESEFNEREKLNYFDNHFDAFRKSSSFAFQETNNVPKTSMEDGTTSPDVYTYEAEREKLQALSRFETMETIEISEQNFEELTFANDRDDSLNTDHISRDRRVYATEPMAEVTEISEVFDQSFSSIATCESSTDCGSEEVFNQQKYIIQEDEETFRCEVSRETWHPGHKTDESYQLVKTPETKIRPFKEECDALSQEKEEDGPSNSINKESEGQMFNDISQCFTDTTTNEFLILENQLDLTVSSVKAENETSLMRNKIDLTRSIQNKPNKSFQELSGTNHESYDSNDDVTLNNETCLIPDVKYPGGCHFEARNLDASQDDKLNDCVNMELDGSNELDDIQKSSSFLLEHSRQPPDGHEFPPRYSELRHSPTVRSPSLGGDSGVFLDDQSGDSSQGSDPVYLGDSIQSSKTNWITAIETISKYEIEKTTNSNNMKQEDHPVHYVTSHQTTDRFESTSIPPDPLLNLKTDSIESNKFSISEEKSCNRTPEKSAEISSGGELKCITRTTSGSLQDKPVDLNKKQNLTDQTGRPLSLGRKDIEMKQKSEENLNLKNCIYKRLFNQNTISVKDRIAMFSRTESDTSADFSDVAQKTIQSREQPDLKENKNYPQLHLSDSPSTNSTNVENRMKRPSEKCNVANVVSLIPKEEFQKRDSSSQNEVYSEIQSSYNSSSDLTINKPVFHSKTCKSNVSNTKKIPNESEFSSGVDTDLQSSSYIRHLGGKSSSCSEISMTNSRSQEDLLTRPSNWNLFSLLQKTSKTNTSKFKGLVIPERPISSNAAVNSLPTIASKTGNVTSKPEPVTPLIHRQLRKESIDPPGKAKSLPRGLSLDSEYSVKTRDTLNGTNKQSLLSDPPWKNYNPSLPKYSPAFKRRSFQLPRSNVTSVSPTPPSSLTSPMSPLPTSPSSISSSNTSSSVGITSPPTVKQQSVFQFSLSHSKPVTPVLPEKPIMPTAPVLSDNEGKDYEQSMGSNPSLDGDMRKPTNSLILKQTKNFPFSKATSSVGNNLFEKNDSFGSLDRIATKNSSTSWDRKYQQNGSCSSAGSSSSNSSELKRNKNPRDQTQTYSSESTALSLTSFNMPRNNSKFDSEEITNKYMPASSEIHGKFMAKPVCIGESETSRQERLSERKASIESPLPNYKNIPSLPPAVFHRQLLVGAENNNNTLQHNSNQKWSNQSFHSRFSSDNLESDDDSFSTLSQRTEDSRHTADDSLSDTTTDSVDHPADAEFKPRRLSQQKTVLRMRQESPSDGTKNFRALAERWEQKSFDGSQEISSPPILPSTHPPVAKRDSQSNLSQNFTVKLPPSLMPKVTDRQPSSRRNSVSSQIFNNSSVSEVKMREKRPSGPRPTSLIEEGEKKKNGNLWHKHSKSITSKETAESFNRSGKLTASRELISRSRESLDLLCTKNRPYISSSTRSMSVSDICKNFENKATNKEASLLPKSKFVGRNSFDSRSSLDIRSVGLGMSNGNSDLIFHHRGHKIFNDSDSALKSESHYRSENHASSSCHPDKFNKIVNSSDNNETSNLNNTDIKYGHCRILGKAQLNSPRTNEDHQTLSLQSDGRDKNFDPCYKSSFGITGAPTRSHSRWSCDDDKSIATAKSVSERSSNRTNLSLTSKPDLELNDQYSNPTSKRSIMNSNQEGRDMLNVGTEHKRFFSIDSSPSESGKNMHPQYQSNTSLTSGSLDRYGSKTHEISLSEATSSQERQKLLEEAIQTLKDEATEGKQEVDVVTIQRELQAGSIGITLAGGADYEVKEITVHKIIAGSLADKNGNVKKGDRVLSINGCSLKGLTHQETLDILKTPRSKVVLVLARSRSKYSEPKSPHVTHHLTNGFHIVPEERKQEKTKVQTAEPPTSSKGRIITVELRKDKTGIGFSLDGGKDSPVGDRPLTIKKLFKGGSADRVGLLKAGDEIVSMNNQTVTNMTRTEAWNFMKKLPEGQVFISVKQCS